MMKKACIFLVMVLLCASFVFAGGQGSKSSSSEPIDYGKRTSGINYWRVKFDQPVDLRMVNWEYTEDIAPGDDVTNNEWTRALKRDLNINVIHDWVSTQNEYYTRLNLAIASGQLPDVFICDNNQFLQLLEANLIADITDYIENNVCDTVKEIMAFAPDVTETAKRNGRLMGLPRYGYGAVSMFTEMWIRHDWSEGKTIPRTIAEYEQLMQTFMREHPGTYGVAMEGNLDRMIQFAPAFGAYPRTWLKASNGSIVYGGVQPEMRLVLQAYADWYRKGFLRSDFMSLTADAVREDIIAGKVGIDTGYNWWGYVYAVDLVLNHGMGAYFDCYELPTPDGKLATYWAPFDNDGYIVYNKNSRAISAALKGLSYVEFHALEAVQQKAMTLEQLRPFLRDGNANQMLKPFYVNDPRLEIIAFEQIQEAARTKKTDHFLTPNIAAKYETGRSWVEDGNPQGVSAYGQTYSAKSGYAVNTPIFNEGRFIQCAMNGPIPQDVIQYGTVSSGVLNDILIEGYIKIIVGQEPISYFDTLVNAWRSAGGDVVTAAINREYRK